MLPQPEIGRRRGTSGFVRPRRESIGVVFGLSLLWLVFELGRPYTPPGVPLLISLIIAVDYLLKGDKQWSNTYIWFFVLIGTAAISIPIAENNFAAYAATKYLAMTFVLVCLPFTALVTTLKQARAWTYTMIGIAMFVGGWATTHSGFGPAAAAGQDENYVATLMGMGVAFAYFALTAERKTWTKVAIGIGIPIFVAAMALANNASRGGFLALVAVSAYCIYRSPKKLMAIGVLLAMGASMLLVAGDSFWKEIETTTDYESGTGDVRLEIWASGMRMWAANPLFGVGGGNFQWTIGEFQTYEQLEKFGRSLGGSIVAHSMHVEMVAELGTMGLIATAALLITTWRSLGKLRRKRPDKHASQLDHDLFQLSCYADGIRAAMIAVLINGIFLSLFYYSHFWLLVAVGSALPFVQRKMLAQAQASGAPQPVPAPPRRRGGMPVPAPVPMPYPLPLPPR